MKFVYVSSLLCTIAALRLPKTPDHQIDAKTAMSVPNKAGANNSAEWQYGANLNRIRKREGLTKRELPKRSCPNGWNYDVDVDDCLNPNYLETDSTQPQNDMDATACVYTDADYQGYGHCFQSVGNYILPDFLENFISSIKVADGCSATLSSGEGAASTAFTGDANHMEPGVNDQSTMISIKCKNVLACVYKGADYTFESACFRREDFINAPWNDEISSIRVRPGCKVRADGNGNFQEPLGEFEQDTNYVGDEANDKISAIEIRCTSLPEEPAPEEPAPEEPAPDEPAPKKPEDECSNDNDCAFLGTTAKCIFFAEAKGFCGDGHILDEPHVTEDEMVAYKNQSQGKRRELISFPRVVYDDGIAKTTRGYDIERGAFLVPFAQAAYETEPPATMGDYSLVATHRGKWLWLSVSIYSKRINDLHTSVIIAFKGTNLDRPREIVSDLSWTQVACTVGSDDTACGMVHNGFLGAYKALQEGILASLDTLGCRPNESGCILSITGHSLGGAIAIIGILDLKLRQFETREISTFGAPRVGDEAFENFFSTHAEHFELSSRFAAIDAGKVQQDGVTMMPWVYSGYARPGKKLIPILSPINCKTPTIPCTGFYNLHRLQTSYIPALEYLYKQIERDHIP
jgi:hypothetical protein